MKVLEKARLHAEDLAYYIQHRERLVRSGHSKLDNIDQQIAEELSSLKEIAEVVCRDLRDELRYVQERLPYLSTSKGRREAD